MNNIYNEFIEKLFAKGKEIGFDQMEVYLSQEKETEISVYEGQIDKYTMSENGGVSFRGISNGKMGYSYSELIADDSIDMLVNEAFSNASIIEADEEVFIFGGSDNYTKIESFNSELKNIDIAKKIEIAKAIEEKAYSLHTKVKTGQCGYTEIESNVMIKNTKGLDLSQDSNVIIAFGYFIVESDDDTRTGSSFKVCNDFNEINPEKIAEEAIEQGVKMLGAKSIESGNYPVIIENRTFADLLSTFGSNYSAENVHKDLSQLKGKLGEQIGNDLFTLIDDPHIPNGLGTQSFDGEGVATSKMNITDKGKLNTFLHNLKTANVDKVKSTGHASKGSFKGTIGISPSNIYLEAGKESLEEIMDGIDKGIYIVSLQGLHSGANSISGDFSLQCYGYEINKGKIGRPVSQIIVAGNYFEVIKNIEKIANDLKFNTSAYGSPSVLIKELAISGE